MPVTRSSQILAGQLPTGASGAMLTEPYARPYTVYVNPSDGSDSNLGNSPGKAFSTLAHAINVVNVAAHRALIKIVGNNTSITIDEPIAFVQGIVIECDVPSGISLNRNFDTTASRSVWDAVTTAAGTSVQSATAAFVSGDVGKIAMIYGAGTGGGTYYGFISAVPDGTHATIPATAIARSSTTDPHGVKLSVVGDWDRVVTDAGMASSSSTLTSATAAFTTADLGREVVIAGAGQNGQALRMAISAVASATSVTVTGVATNTVSGVRCAVGANFGDMFVYHTSNCGLRNFVVQDSSSSSTRIGSALKFICDDLGSGVQSAIADHAYEYLTFTSQLAAGAWEHMIDCDGSWNQNASGGGARRFSFDGCKFFGARRPTETIRLASAVHWNFRGHGIVGNAPTSFAQGIAILDPQKTGGFSLSSDDVNFSNFEGVATYYYCEGQHCSFHGGRVSATVVATGHRAVELSPNSAYCSVVTVNASTLTGVNIGCSDEYDAGANNVIETNVNHRVAGKGEEASVPTSLTYETYPRRGASNGDVSRGSSGVMVLQAIWLPGGKSITRVALMGGSTALAWGSGYSNPHFFYGLFDPDGNLIGQSADGGGTAAFSNAFSTTAGTLTAATTIPRSGLCFIGLLINSGTAGSGFTYPNFGGMTNALAGVNPSLCGTSGSAQTALPGSVTVPLASGVGSEIYGGVL